jgi:hypothetical protein
MNIFSIFALPKKAGVKKGEKIRNEKYAKHYC